MRILSVGSAILAILCSFNSLVAAQERSEGVRSYLGFDRNDYPGDQLLPALHKTFEWTGYWLNNAPGAQNNSWSGKREIVKAAGFGFAVLYNGRVYKELKGKNPAEIGSRDGKDAAARANAEGFHAGTIIFIDQEEGGRMLPEQLAYLRAWFNAVISAGFKAGVYCSSMPVKEGPGQVVVTAKDIHDRAGVKDIAIWAYDDACGPSRGCVFPKHPPAPSKSGVAYAAIWQFAQSPRRPEAAACEKNYAADGSCYAPEMPVGAKLYVDVNSATSADPSHGR